MPSAHQSRFGLYDDPDAVTVGTIALLTQRSREGDVWLKASEYAILGYVAVGAVCLVLRPLLAGGLAHLKTLDQEIAALGVMVGLVTLSLVAVQIIIARKQVRLQELELQIIRNQEADRLRTPDLTLQWQHSGNDASGKPNPLHTMWTASEQENTPLGLFLSILNEGKMTTGVLIELWLPAPMKIITNHEFHSTPWLPREGYYDSVPGNLPPTLRETRYTLELPMLRIPHGPPVELSVVMITTTFVVQNGTPYTIKYRLTSEGHVFPEGSPGILEFKPVATNKR